MSGHTPGPWRVYHADFGEGCIEIGVTTDGDGADICEMQNEGYFGKEQVEANARLIAASPALLALVERCLPFVKMRANRFEGDGVIDRVQDLATVLEHDIRQVLAAVREGEK